MTATNLGFSSPSISAEAVRVARFSTKRHGVDEKEVRAFLDAVANDIQVADAERASLRAELHEIRAEVERIRGTVTAEESQSRMEISVHAVGTPDLARSWTMSSPDAPPASPAASTSWPKARSTRATVTPRPPAR